MKRFFILTATLLCMGAALAAQSNSLYIQRYNSLVSRVGFAGVGVETLLDNWAKADSADVNVHIGRFNYYFAKAQTLNVTVHEGKTFLGEKPVLTLKDSLGRNVNYFNEYFYDDQLVGEAIKAIDRAISLKPERLDLCVIKADALVDYEKESPDLATQYLLDLARHHFVDKPSWEPENEVDDETFCNLIQGYCYRFSSTATPQSYESFRRLSEAMCKYQPRNTVFINNLGSYYSLAKKNDKTALKYYKKSLKVNPDDEIAAKNIEIINRRLAAAKKKK